MWSTCVRPGSVLVNPGTRVVCSGFDVSGEAMELLPLSYYRDLVISYTQSRTGHGL